MNLSQKEVGGEPPSPGVLIGQIEAEMNLQMARVRILRVGEDVFDVQGVLNDYRLELSLRPGRSLGGMCFRDRWKPHHFEPAGDLYLIPPGELVHARGETSSRYSIVCELMPAAVQNWFDDELDWTDRGLRASLNISSPCIRTSLNRLARELLSPGFAHEAVCELLIAQAAVDIARYCEALDELNCSGGLGPNRLRLVEERLAEVAPPPTLAELAAICNLSVRQLTRGFRTDRNCSIGEYIAQKRIDHAKQLLARDHSIKEIARQLGFSSAGNFSTAFRRATGESPRNFRDLVRLVH